MEAQKKSARYSLVISLLTPLVFWSCSSPYKLKAGTPDQGSNESCSIQVSFLESTTDETLFKLAITNKSDAVLEISQTAFVLSTSEDVLSNSPVNAIEAQPYIKNLSAQAELMEARANNNTWLGMDALSGSDEYRKLKSEHETVERERKENLMGAKKLREQIARINGRTLERINIEAGKTIEGVLVFQTSVKKDGPIQLESQNPICNISLPLTLE